jgi:hypothetical protein
MKNSLFKPVVTRLGEDREAAVLAKVVAWLQHSQNDLMASRKIRDDLDRQPLLLELYTEHYVLTGEYTGEQLNEILNIFLLTWHFHEDLYGFRFQPLTITVYNQKLKEKQQWALTHVGDDAATAAFLEQYEPRVLLTYFWMITAQPSEAMATLSLDERFNLQLTYMALTACFQAQRVNNNG